VSISMSKFVTKEKFNRRFKRLKVLMKAIIKNQKETINTINTLTAFKATSLAGIDGKNENVRQKDEIGNTMSTTKRRRRSHRTSEAPSIEDIKGFFHGRGYTIKDDGKKPIKILDKDGHKKFVVVRKNLSIWKRNSETKKYKQVYLEDMV